LFERFTERARQVVVLAQDEARALKHNYIGTEHILLGLLREEEGLAARVLESLDITVEEVRAQVARIVGQGDEVTTGQIPFTPRAKKVLELALREALSLGHNYIGTEHILLGLVRENEGVAARILLDFDLDAEKVRDQTIAMSAAPAPRTRPPSPMSDPLRLVDLAALTLALEEAKLRLIEEVGSAVSAVPPEGVVREYGVKTLDGTSDTWAEWRRDGWELISVVQEGGAVRAILERRRRNALT
jgi:ATP-dependent Clp protease ATP-binding subunit ClpA